MPHHAGPPRHHLPAAAMFDAGPYTAEWFGAVVDEVLRRAGGDPHDPDSRARVAARLVHCFAEEMAPRSLRTDQQAAYRLLRPRGAQGVPPHWWANFVVWVTQDVAEPRRLVDRFTPLLARDLAGGPDHPGDEH